MIYGHHLYSMQFALTGAWSLLTDQEQWMEGTEELIADSSK